MRPLPFNIEAEQSVLGSLLLDPEAFKRTRALLSPGDFYRESHRDLFGLMCRLHEHGKMIDDIALHDMGADLVKLSELRINTPTALHLDHYAQLVKEHAEKRQLVALADQLSRMAYDDSLPVMEAKKAARALVRDLTAETEARGLQHITVATAEALEDVEQLMLHEVGPAIPCALGGLRRLIHGYHPSEQTVIGARPNVGKTSIALEEALHAARLHRKAVAIFSLEMGRKSIGKRALARAGQMGLSLLRNGPVGQDDYTRGLDTHEALGEAPLYLDTTPKLSAPEIHARCEAFQRREGALDLVIVDYVQIMGSPFGRGSGGRSDNQKRLEVAENALQLREMARELDCHVILLSQINRAATNRANARPTVSDLKESGAIEEVADTVILLHDASKYDDSQPRGLVELIVAKGRNDATGTAKALLDGATGTWTDFDEAPDWLARQEPPAPREDYW